MARLGQLKSRIAKKLDRDDFDAELGDIVNEAIRFYAPRHFWFNRKFGTASTVASTATVTRPTGLRYEFNTPGSVQVAISGSDTRNVFKASLTEILHLRDGTTTEDAPYVYADNGTVWELYPTPDAIYTITVAGVYDEAALTDDDSSNDWTLYAEDLIDARARIIAARDYAGVDMTDLLPKAQLAEAEALRHLVAETARRAGTGRLRPHL